MKFAVCVETLFTNLPFLERLEKVKESGVGAFEFWDWKWKDVDAIDRKRRELGLEVSSFLFNPILPSLVKSDVTTQLQEAVASSIKIAQKLDCKILMGPVGLGNRASRLVSHEKQLRNAVRNLDAVKSMLEDADVTLVFEPGNHVEFKDCFLTEAGEGFDLVKAVGSPNIKLLYDFHHQQVSEGKPVENMKSNFDLIGLFHVGDAPKRTEPGTGEIDFREVFKFMSDKACDKYVSMEFTSTIDDMAAVKQTVQMADFSK